MQFKTVSGNRYYYSEKQGEFILCHPVLFYLIHQKISGNEVEDWVASVPPKGVYLDGKLYSKKDVNYYYKKFQLLLLGGYFEKQDNNHLIEWRIRPEDAEASIASTDQLLFETTDRCNMKCVYCGYGQLYENYDPRDGKDMDFTLAKKLIDFLFNYWKADDARHYNKVLHIGFYGGEPLLNFGLIQDIVNYLEELPSIEHIRFTYGMTTNGLLLDKFIDFIVEKDMDLLVSLDGDRAANDFRILANGEPSFDYIMKNLELIRNRFPDFFEKNISFNAVVHSKNSITGLYSFFKSHFNKIPRIAALNPDGLKESKRKLFEKLFYDINKSLESFEMDGTKQWDHPLYPSIPRVKELMRALLKFNGHSYHNYNDLIFPGNTRKKIPTSTCLPFSRKIYLTVNGKLLPCERIGHQYNLGMADNKQVSLDFEEIAKKYNRIFDNVSRQCSGCAHIRNCEECIFSWGSKSFDNGRCPVFKESSRLAGYLSDQISFLEERTALLSKMLKEIDIS
jgi:uncharacterized protein